MANKEEVPDFFEDPADVAEKEAKKLFNEDYHKHADVLARASSWFVCWRAYALNPDSQENPAMEEKELFLALAMKSEYLLLEILAELKKLNGRRK